MAKLKLLLLAASCIAAPGAARAGEVDRWSAFIAEASARFHVPEAWIRRVIQAESGGRTTLGGRPIVSRAGARGLMQLMPGTWGAMRAAHGLGPDPHDPRDNILAGTAYLRAMYDRFGYPGLFAAYNAGPARYAAYLNGARRLPAETVAYVGQVARRSAVTIGSARAAPAAAAARAVRAPEPAEAAAQTVFAIRATSAQPVGLAAAEAPSPPARAGASLFVPLRTDRP